MWKNSPRPGRVGKFRERSLNRQLNWTFFSPSTRTLLKLSMSLYCDDDKLEVAHLTAIYSRYSYHTSMYASWLFIHASQLTERLTFLNTTTIKFVHFTNVNLCVCVCVRDPLNCRWVCMFHCKPQIFASMQSAEVGNHFTLLRWCVWCISKPCFDVRPAFLVGAHLALKSIRWMRLGGRGIITSKLQQQQQQQQQRAELTGGERKEREKK